MRDGNKLSKRQQHILRFMETFIDKMGFPPTIRQIGEATGINSTSVVNYNLNKLVASGHLERTERASRGMRLIKSDGKGGTTPVVALARNSIGLVNIPLIGQIVASEPVSVPEDAGYYYGEEDMIEVTQGMLNGVDAAEVYALRVKGDSMIDAMVQDGDIVLLRKQTTAKDGEMVAVWLAERNETTLKHFYPEGKRVRLQPAHPTMDAIYTDATNCHIQGRVLSVIRQVV